MDGASAVAGLIGLAALAGQSTVKLIKFFKDARGLSEKLQDDLRWLTQLQQVLLDFQGTYTRVQALQLDIDLGRAADYLKDCRKVAQEVIQYVEARHDSLQGSNIVKRRLKQVKSTLEQEEVERRLKDLRRTMQLLETFNTNMGLYVLPSVIIMYG